MIVKFPWEKLEELLKETKPYLDDEYEYISEMFNMARLMKYEPLGDVIQSYLLAARADARNQGPFKLMEGEPVPDDGHIFVCGQTGTGKTVEANITIVKLAKEKYL